MIASTFGSLMAGTVGANSERRLDGESNLKIGFYRFLQTKAISTVISGLIRLTMPFSKLLVAATLVVAAASADVPTLTSKYCADVVEVRRGVTHVLTEL